MLLILVGRGVAGLFVLLVVTMLVAQGGPPDPSILSYSELVSFAGLAIAAIGSVACWWRPWMGGVLIVCGWAAIASASGTIAIGAWLTSIAVAGGLLILGDALRGFRGPVRPTLSGRVVPGRGFRESGRATRSHGGPVHRPLDATADRPASKQP